jgi:Tfp pilus assembly protein PilX
MKLLESLGRIRSRRGSAMIAALLVVLAVATLTLVHVQLDLSRAREHRTTVDTKSAFYMAEAGLAEGFLGIVSGKSGNVGTSDAPARFANGIFYTVATEEGGGRVTLTSTGMCGAGRATLSILIERASATSASLGIFGDQGVTVEGGAYIDSWDGSSGRYAPPAIPVQGPLPTGARLGSNGNMTVGTSSTSTYVLGDAQPGPNGVLVRGRNTTISGTTAPFLEPQDLPDVHVPSYPSSGTIATSLLQPLLGLMPGEYGFDALRVAAATKLKIVGPARIVVGDLVVEGQGELALDTSRGPIELYVTDWLALKSLATLTSNAGDTRSVSIQVSASASKDQDGNGSIDPPVVIGATSKFKGSIYAPDAAVTIPSNFEVFGAVAASQLTVKSGAKLHFDTSLLTAASGDPSRPRMLGWRLVELPNVPVVRLRYDALKSLVDTGVTPVRSASAHLNLGVEGG